LDERGSTDCFVDSRATAVLAVPQRIGANVKKSASIVSGMVRMDAGDEFFVVDPRLSLADL